MFEFVQFSGVSEQNSGVDHESLRNSVARAVTSATLEVFSTMMGAEIEQGEPYTEAGKPGPMDGVVSFIGLAGSWIGTGSICCNEKMACRVCSSLLLTDAHGVNEEVLDAMAELTNMVIGNVKNALEEELGPMALSIPTVVFGRNFTAMSASREQWTIVPFLWDGEKIEIKLCLAQVSHSHAPSR